MGLAQRGLGRREIGVGLQRLVFQRVQGGAVEQRPPAARRLRAQQQRLRLGAGRPRPSRLGRRQRSVGVAGRWGGSVKIGSDRATARGHGAKAEGQAPQSCARAGLHGLRSNAPGGAG